MAGKAFLVGAGPGDPELLTLKAARAIGAAEVAWNGRLAGVFHLAGIPGIPHDDRLDTHQVRVQRV